MDWIKVTDEFPEEHIKVLGIYAMGISGAEILSVEWSKEGGWSAQGLNYDKLLVVSYWSKFPSVPEEWWK